MLVVIEGPDGAGKSVLAAELMKRLSQKDQFRHITARSLAFPDRASPVGQAVDRLLRTHQPDPLVLQALQTMNRYEHLDELRAAAARKDPYIGTTLVLDRYWQSGVVYGGLDGLKTDYVRRLQDGLPRAQINILLDVPAELSHQRRKQGVFGDHYDAKSLGWYKLVRERYRNLWIEEQAAVTGELVDPGERWVTIEGGANHPRCEGVFSVVPVADLVTQCVEVIRGIR